MSWWAVVYFGLFGVLSVAGLWDDFCERRPAWFLTCAVVSNLIVAYLIVAYWRQSLSAALGIVAPVAFVVSMGWELFQEVEYLHEMHSDPELSEGEQNVFTHITAIVTLAICLPAYIVAGISAFRG
jgi:hypothetical protein